MKIYQTLKTEAPKGKFRRPPDEFIVDEAAFVIGMATPYNKGISNFENFALNEEEAIPEMEFT